MFSRLFNLLFNRGCKGTVNKDCTVVYRKKTRDDLIREFDYSKYPEPNIINPEKEQTLLILDDLPDTLCLFTVDFERIERKYKRNPYNDFKIVELIGKECGFSAHKYIKHQLATGKSKVDIAILDITLGYMERVEGGDVIEFDGIDVAIELLKVNPNTKIIFATAHTLDRRDRTMAYYYNKFEKATGKTLDAFYLHKLGDRTDEFHSLIYGVDQGSEI